MKETDMKIEREWQHDHVTEEVGNLVVEALENGPEATGEVELSIRSDRGGEIVVIFAGRRFELNLREVVS
jgi:hypothetical protein